MTFFRRMMVVSILTLLVSSSGYAINRSTEFYRNFYLTAFHGERLAYCNSDGKHCGMPVANCYCKIMGYKRADQQIIDHNVGLTNFLDKQASCKGWRCNGFKTIRCVGNLTHKPPKPYHYSLRRFVYPRYEHYRVDWCYDGQHGCGKKAAYSFCRRMGYMNTQHFVEEKKIGATKAIGNQKLCFGNQCKAFKYITCSR